MKVPEKIQHAFVKFIFRGGYKVKPTPQGVQYYKAGKDALFIDTNCQMNEAMKARWDLFCRVWLRDGKEFLDELGVK